MTKRKYCKNKTCRKTLQPAPQKLQVARHWYDDDPYCCRVCCEKDHGIKHAAGHTSMYPEDLADAV